MCSVVFYTLFCRKQLPVMMRVVRLFRNQSKELKDSKTLLKNTNPVWDLSLFHIQAVMSSYFQYRNTYYSHFKVRLGSGKKNAWFVLVIHKFARVNCSSVPRDKLCSGSWIRRMSIHKQNCNALRYRAQYTGIGCRS